MASPPSSSCDSASWTLPSSAAASATARLAHGAGPVAPRASSRGPHPAGRSGGRSHAKAWRVRLRHNPRKVAGRRSRGKHAAFCGLWPMMRPGAVSGATRAL
eukprot:2564100-Prymnesium_polylepis.1